MSSRIFKCNCRHDFQDKQHGKGKRVYNEGVKVWRCTVCGNEKSK